MLNELEKIEITKNMFNLFKKKPKGLNARQRALEVIRIVEQTTEDWRKDTDKFLNTHSKYLAEKNNIIDEIQWIPYVSAITGILSISNAQVANDTLKSLVEVLRQASMDGETNRSRNNQKN